MQKIPPNPTSETSPSAESEREYDAIDAKAKYIHAHDAI